MIQGIQERSGNEATAYMATVNSVLSGFREGDVNITPADSENHDRSRGPSTTVQFGPFTFFSEAGRQLTEWFNSQPQTECRPTITLPPA